MENRTIELQGNCKVNFKLSSGKVVTVTMLNGVNKLLITDNKPERKSQDIGDWIATVAIFVIWLAASATAYHEGGIITLWCVGIMVAAVCAAFLCVLWCTPNTD